MILFSTIFGAKAQDTDTIKILDPVAFQEAISKEQVQLIDVRTAMEYKQGHISNARNLDFFQQATFKDSVEKLDKNKPVYLYCRSGNRSQKAAHLLAKIGFAELYDLSGGYMQWPFKNE